MTETERVADDEIEPHAPAATDPDDAAAATTPAEDDDLAPPDDGRRGGAPLLSPWLSWAVAAVLALVCVVGVVGVVVYAAHLRPRVSAGQADQADRTAATRVAEEFMVEFNTYDYRKLAAYRSSLDRLLSTKAKAKFSQGVQQSLKLIRVSKLRSTGTVLASGVQSIDPDSARVLVVGDATATTTQGERARHFRWDISLVKVNGRWLVDDFEGIS